MRTRRALSIAALAVTGFFAHGALAPSEVKAEIPDSLREGTKPLELRLGLGPAIGMTEGGGVFGKAAFEVLYHFFKRADGPALGGYIHGLFGVGGGGMQIGPMFAWDFRLVEGLGLYLAPTFGLGYGFLGGEGVIFHFFDMQFGATARLIINDGFEVFLRPVHFDLYFIPAGGVVAVAATYDIIAGVGYNF